MTVSFTREREIERIAQTRKDRERPTSWEILRTTSLVEAVRKAKDLGWKEKKVQVRYENIRGVETYFVEPYEPGCGCKGMLKYKNYFN